MSVNKHLSEDQITEWALGASDETVLRHLEDCAVCSREAEELRSTLAGFRDAVHASARRDPKILEKPAIRCARTPLDKRLVSAALGVGRGHGGGFDCRHTSGSHS